MIWKTHVRLFLLLGGSDQKQRTVPYRETREKNCQVKDRKSRKSFPVSQIILITRIIYGSSICNLFACKFLRIFCLYNTII